MLPDTRAKHLDALRGLAAAIVCCAHFLAAFYPYAVFAGSDGIVNKQWWEAAFLIPPLSILTAGHFAVCLFFVLSGFVLSVRMLGQPRQDKAVVAAIIKRPIRLLGLTIFSVLLGALVWSLGLLYHREAAEIAGSQAWFLQFWQGEFSGSELLRKLVTGRAGAEYNPPLWTIKIELIGSMMVFFALFVLNRLSFGVRCALLVALIALTYGTYYEGFFIGILLADLFNQRNEQINAICRKSPNSWRLMAIAAIMFAAFPYYAFRQSIPDDGAFVTTLLTAIAPHSGMLGATLMFLVVMTSARLQALLKWRWFIWLGTHSFSIYVTHFIVLGTICAWLVVALNSNLGYGASVALSGVVYLAVLLPLAVTATRLIDAPSINLARLVERRVFGFLPARWR